MTPGESSKTSQFDPGVASRPADSKLVLGSSGRESKPVEISTRTGKPKRRKAVRACTNCQRTHLTCDDDRPCERCVKRGCADTCVDGERKKSKRTRSKQNDTNLAKNDLSQYVPDLLMSQGHIPHMDMTQQPSPHTIPLHQYPLFQGAQKDSLRNFNNYVPHLGSSVSYPHRPMQHFSSTQHYSTRNDHLHSHSHTHVHSHTMPDSPPHRASTPDFTQGIPRIASHVHNHESDESSGKYANQTYQPYDNGANDHRVSHAVDQYGAAPEYYEPLETYPFPSQPPLYRFTSEIQGTTTRLNKKDCSVISSMLQNNPHHDDVGEAIIELHEEGNDPENTVVRPSDDPVETKGSDHMLLWLEPLSNPLANAHNDYSGRFSYNYEQTDPSEVYRKVTEPFPNRAAFSQMVDYLKTRLPSNEFKNLVDHLGKLKSQFNSITRPLTKDDHLFVEQSFQRSLLEEEKQFTLTPVPCLVWRRSGVVAAVSPRFSKLTQWAPDRLNSGFIMQAMNTESIREYLENFYIAVSNHQSEFKFNCVLMTPSGSEIPTEAEVTIRRDLFNTPMTIVGKFWVKKKS